MKEIRLASKILKTLIKDRIQYPGRLVVDTTGIVARCGVTLALYWKVFELNNGVINGTTFLFAAWSMAFYFSFSMLRIRDISTLIMQDVQSGNIEMLLNKPINYLSYRMWWQIGSGAYSFLVITTLVVIVLSFSIGFPSTMKTFIFLPTLFSTFVFSLILSLFLYSIIGILSFWMEDIRPIYWIIDKSVMMLGGSYLPIALFPAFMYKIALYSPIGATQFITHAVNESWQTNWWQLLGIQFFWIILLGGIVYFMFEKAKQKVSVNGG